MKIKDEAADSAWSAFTSLGVYASDKARMMKALEAALPLLLKGAVSVKPLEWGVYPSLNRGRKLIATDCLGMDYVRLDLKDQSPEEIEAYKARIQAEYNRDILSAIYPAPVGVTPTHRHKKRGTDYALIGYGKMQAEDWFERTPPHGDPASIDMSEVAIYQSVDDGSLWVRPREDFEDGRFEDLASHEPAPTDANDELERVDADANAMAWGAELKSAEARILELEADLEVANDKLRKMVKT